MSTANQLSQQERFEAMRRAAQDVDEAKSLAGLEFLPVGTAERIEIANQLWIARIKWHGLIPDALLREIDARYFPPEPTTPPPVVATEAATTPTQIDPIVIAIGLKATAAQNGLNLSVREAAKRVGISTSRLQRSQLWRDTCNRAKQYSGRKLPRGNKSKDGELEAVDD